MFGAKGKSIGLARFTVVIACVAGLGASACGRSDIAGLEALASDRDVAASKEVDVADHGQVLVEVYAPAMPGSVDALSGMPDGLTIDEVIDALVGDMEAELVVDTTAGPASMQIVVDDNVRAIVWL